MRAQLPAFLSESDVEAIAARLFELMCACGAAHNALNTTDPDRLIDWEAVTHEVQKYAPKGTKAVCRQTVWRLVREGKLPEPIRLNARVARWRYGDVVAYLSKKGPGRPPKIAAE
jgi:predicted DNA-binding transcriptional regulator AlpA